MPDIRIQKQESRSVRLPLGPEQGIVVNPTKKMQEYDLDWMSGHEKPKFAPLFTPPCQRKLPRVPLKSPIYEKQFTALTPQQIRHGTGGMTHFLASATDNARMPRKNVLLCMDDGEIRFGKARIYRWR